MESEAVMSSPMNFIKFKEYMLDIKFGFEELDKSYTEEKEAYLYSLCTMISKKFLDNEERVWYYFIDLDERDYWELYVELVENYNGVL